MACKTQSCVSSASLNLVNDFGCLDGIYTPTFKLLLKLPEGINPREGS